MVRAHVCIYIESFNATYRSLFRTRFSLRIGAILSKCSFLFLIIPTVHAQYIIDDTVYANIEPTLNIGIVQRSLTDWLSVWCVCVSAWLTSFVDRTKQHLELCTVGYIRQLSIGGHVTRPCLCTSATHGFSCPPILFPSSLRWHWKSSVRSVGFEIASKCNGPELNQETMFP